MSSGGNVLVGLAIIAGFILLSVLLDYVLAHTVRRIISFEHVRGHVHILHIYAKKPDASNGILTVEFMYGNNTYFAYIDDVMYDKLTKLVGETTLASYNVVVRANHPEHVESFKLEEQKESVL